MQGYAGICIRDGFPDDVADAAIESVDAEGFCAAEGAVDVEEDWPHGSGAVRVGQHAEEFAGAGEAGAAVQKAVVVHDVGLAWLKRDGIRVLVDLPAQRWKAVDEGG